MRIFFTVASLFLFIGLNAQTVRIDFYKNDFLQANTNAQKLEALLRLLEERESLSTDSLSHYIIEAKGLEQLHNNKKAYARIVIAETYMNIRLGKLNQAREEIDAVLKNAYAIYV